MARKFIKELQPGTLVDQEIFFLAEKDLRSSANGSLYIHAVLRDRSGAVTARMWQATRELYALLPQDGFVKVRGRTENYKGMMQFVLEGIEPVHPDTPIVIEDFLPSTQKDVEEMFKRMLEILRTIKDRHLLYLIKQFVDDKELMADFKKAPAAIVMHHACLGGLLEHTLNMMELATLLGPRYPQINMDLMLAGVFLHDIGKTRELAWETGFKYTDSGQLLGHLMIGVMMIQEKARKVQDSLGEPFPPDLLQVLEHMIISHHGDYEYGSPKLPMTAEALALHHLDNLDAKLEMVKQQIEEADPGSDWTKYVRSMERKFYKFTGAETQET